MISDWNIHDLKWLRSLINRDCIVEIISNINSHSLTFQENLISAIEFFSIKKKLSTEQLLTIYKVERDENRGIY